MHTDNPDRRRLLQWSLLAVPALAVLSRVDAAFADTLAKLPAGGAGSVHDFDFFIGSWNVKHRRLKQRLAGSNEWEEFDGTTKCQSLLDGMVNLNESIVHRGGGTYRGMGLRAYDAKTNTWADWYLDGRDPTQLDPPGLGRFADGVGTFLSDDTYEGKPVKVRGLFKSISATTCQWEQAYSPDGGKSWETNWVMRYTRTA
jgi:hypothetical protein